LCPQVSQLQALREQLQQELSAARRQLQELGAAQDGLRAQVKGRAREGRGREGRAALKGMVFSLVG